jgi:hypothetical protein
MLSAKQEKPMAKPTFLISKAGDGRFKFAWTTDDGKLVTEVKISRARGLDNRSDAEKKTEAQAILKKLVDQLAAHLGEKKGA